jgi:hypothetical protein
MELHNKRSILQPPAKASNEMRRENSKFGRREESEKTHTRLTLWLIGTASLGLESTDLGQSTLLVSQNKTRQTSSSIWI